MNYKTMGNYAGETVIEYNTPSSNKTTKPGFIKRWFYKTCKEAWFYDKQHGNKDDDFPVMKNNTIFSSPSIDQPDRAIQFTVYYANGGRVIETRRYNTKTDRSVNGLYIITSDQDFGNEIDKIITMEALKQ